ncbi:MAG: aldehyde dehydrogenase family protein [Proteobacteria bacterium]|nr:aldehyde dehydrogenase family protein [Pseudomonadota bacterium]HQR03086.1 aldehyde dehydrogenase family protein [Rhodocyclaceae bacterium]
MRTFALLIDGQSVAPNADLAVINPADESVFTHCPRTTPALLEQAVTAARRSFASWRTTPFADRAGILLKLADRIDANKDEIARVLTLEQGKPIATAENEVSYAALFCRHFAGFTFPPQIVQDDATQRVEVHRKPLGVVAAIVPWNFPFLQAVYKTAPALLMGNTVVLKPAPTTPLTSLFLGELIKDLVPPGVVNVVTDGGDIGPLLSAHPDIAKVSFTGSTAVGRSVMAAAAPTLKRLTLELGGNDAAIVLDDVDVDDVAAKIFGGAFFNSGQVCIAIKRIFVQEDIYDRFCDAMAGLAGKAVVGNGLDAASEFGPLQNKAQFQRTQRYMELARTHGRIIAGGKTMGPGYFFQPTLVRDIAEGNPLVDEETFGPVRPLIKFKTPEEAVARANQSPYGLGGSVWSGSIDRAQALAGQLECGTAWVNQHLGFGPHIPFGGTKQSGLGVEFSPEGVLEFSDIQVVSIAKG